MSPWPCHLPWSNDSNKTIFSRKKRTFFCGITFRYNYLVFLVVYLFWHSYTSRDHLHNLCTISRRMKKCYFFHACWVGVLSLFLTLFLFLVYVYSSSELCCGLAGHIMVLLGNMASVFFYISIGSHNHIHKCHFCSFSLLAMVQTQEVWTKAMSSIVQIKTSTDR